MKCKPIVERGIDNTFEIYVMQVAEYSNPGNFLNI